MNKRQKRNRKRLLNFTTIVLFIEFMLTFGIVGNIEQGAKTSIIIIWFYVINSIFSIISIELCDYLKIKI